MRQSEHTQLIINQLLPIARAAGDAIMSIDSADSVQTKNKAYATPVTEADLASHRVLALRLTPLLANCPVVSEEDAESQTYRQGKGSFWLVDPVDGTKEFIDGSGEFTVNIALIEDGRAVFGVVYAHAADALYWGSLGAFRSLKGEVVAINVAAESAVGGAKW